MDAEFSFTNRAVPFVEVGVGDPSQVDPSGPEIALWDVDLWDSDEARWTGAGEQEWIDVTCFVHQWESFLGRHRVTDRFEPGTLTLVASNESGWCDLDPENITEVPMRPGRHVRVGVLHEVMGKVILWRGYVDSLVPSYDPVLHDIVTVECICALGEVGRQKLAEVDSPVGAGEAGSARIARILNRALWPPEARDIDTTSVQMIGTRMGGQVADLLTQCADSEGGAVFGDQQGQVAYRGMDWQLWDTGTPPDNVVGNVVPFDLPAVPAHLEPMVGTVTSPDIGPMPNTFTIVMRLQGPNAPDGTIASQGDVEGNLAWRLERCGNDNEWDKQGCLTFYSTPDGTAAAEVEREIKQLAVDDEVEWLAFTITQTVVPAESAVTYGLGTYGSYTYGQASTGDELCSMIAWRSHDGIDWYVHSTNNLMPAIEVFDSTAPLVIGGGDPIFDGSIVMVECRNGETPVAGSLLWRFDAAEVPYGATSYTDPRDRTWTLTVPEAVVPYQGPVISDVCPTSLEISHRRTDLVTQVMLGREGDEFPQLYNDDAGQALYGWEPYESGDLICQQLWQLDLLGARLFRTRGYKNAPRVESIGFTAARGSRVVDLMTTVDPFKPTRLRTRLQRARGKVYDRENLVSGVEMFVSRDEWTCKLSLDVAKPFEIPAEVGRWDTDRWNKATWSEAV